MKTIAILGIRGVPAAHGGFETFAEHLAIYLVQRGWRVVVYCQEDGSGRMIKDTWQGVERVRIPISIQGAKGTMVFDWKAICHAASFKDFCLTFGYNTASFCALLRLRGVTNLINMDGIEWKRHKWGWAAKAWFYLNDWAGCWLGNHLIADHPEIKKHLMSRVQGDKITTIAYGSDRVTCADEAPVRAFGLEPGRYLTLVARAEPENSILEVVSAFSCRPRGYRLAVLGRYDPEGNAYHRAVRDAASDEVSFVGAIYDKAVVQALRFHSAAYMHGHQVGGTNPSLVEAMGAGNAIIAHDNLFNRWVAGSSARYFLGTGQCAALLDELLGEPELLGEMRKGSVHRHREAFTWDAVLAEYEALLSRWLPRDS